MADNGQNESDKPDEQGVLGPARPREYGTRSDLLIIQQAFENGWTVKQEWRDGLPVAIAKIAVQSQHERNKIAAVNTLMAMDRMRIDAALKMNDIYRTERLTDDLAARIADDIRNRPAVAPAPPPGAVPTGNGNGAVQGRAGGPANGQDHDR